MLKKKIASWNTFRGTRAAFVISHRHLPCSWHPFLTRQFHGICITFWDYTWLKSPCCCWLYCHHRDPKLPELGSPCLLRWPALSHPQLFASFFVNILATNLTKRKKLMELAYCRLTLSTLKLYLSSWRPNYPRT